MYVPNFQLTQDREHQKCYSSSQCELSKTKTQNKESQTERFFDVTIKSVFVLEICNLLPGKAMWHILRDTD